MACDILVHSDIKLKIYYREKYRQRYNTDAFIHTYIHSIDP